MIGQIRRNLIKEYYKSLSKTSTPNLNKVIKRAKNNNNIYHNNRPLNATAQMHYYKQKYKPTMNNPQNLKEIEQKLKYTVGAIS
jgi:hypothetical protein